MCMSAQAVGDESPDGVRLGRFLPLSIGVTAVVTVLPLVLVSQLGPARSARLNRRRRSRRPDTPAIAESTISNAGR